MVKSIIEGLCKFFEGCPAFESYCGIGANFKGNSIDEGGILEENTEELSSYLSGGSLNRLHASIYLGAMSDEDMLRLENSAFLRSIRLWVKRQSDLGNYPELPEGCTPQDISADEGEAFEYEDEQGSKCTYRIPINLDYMEV